MTAFLSLRGATQSQDAEDETASQTKRRARGDKWRVTARSSFLVTCEELFLCHREELFLCHCEERSDEAVLYFHRVKEKKETASPDERARLAMTIREARLLRRRDYDLAMTCLGQKARLLRRRYYDLAVTPSPVIARAEGPKQSGGIFSPLRAKRSNPGS